MIIAISNQCISDTISQTQGIDKTIETISHLVTVSNDTISNELSAANTLLVVFSILLALVSVGLGIYISVLHYKVNTIKKSIDEKEQTILEMAKTVEDTERKIHSDIRGLYEDLRYEETMTLLHRLEEEPQDISNLSDLLLARPLNDDGFYILKKAFMKLKSLGPKIYVDYISKPSYSKQYTLLFFQHYLRESLLDDDLRPDIIKDFKRCMECAFKRDIIKSTEGLCLALSVSNSSFDKVALLVDYLKALNLSEYRNLIELTKIFRNNLNKELLDMAIDRCTSDKCYLSMFGVYKPDNSNGEDNSDYKEDE